MKWVTVQEYADLQGICLAAAYKRIEKKKVISEKKFGRTVIKVK